MRRALPGVATAVLIGGSTTIAFFAGGFFDRPRLVACAVAWVLVVLAALFAERPLPASTPGWMALGGLSLLCGWTALSVGWAPIAGRAEDDLQRLLLYTGTFIAAMAFLRDAGLRRWVEPGLAIGVLVMTLYGLSERLLPGLIEFDRSRTATGRLEQPLTYWNAFGILAVFGLILSIRIAGDPERPGPLRAAASAACVPLGLGVYLSFARGALAALAVGLLVLVALAPALREQLRSILTAVVTSTVAAALASGLSGVKSLTPGESGHTGDGLVMLLAVLLLAAGAAAFTLRRPRRELPELGLPVSRSVGVLGLGAIVLVAGLLAVALLEGTPRNTSPAPDADPARLASIDTNRYQYWQLAAREFWEHPVAGVGSGGFAVEWLKERDRIDASTDAHSLYLETALELGLVGLLVLLVFIAGVGAAAVRLYRLDARAAAGPGAVLVAAAFHAGLDWDWEMPAVALPALILAAALVAWSESPGSNRGRRGALARRGPAPADDLAPTGAESAAAP
jgi:O-Antigen ligase